MIARIDVPIPTAASDASRAKLVRATLRLLRASAIHANRRIRGDLPQRSELASVGRDCPSPRSTCKNSAAPDPTGVEVIRLAKPSGKSPMPARLPKCCLSGRPNRVTRDRRTKDATDRLDADTELETECARATPEGLPEFCRVGATRFSI